MRHDAIRFRRAGVGVRHRRRPAGQRWAPTGDV